MSEENSPDWGKGFSSSEMAWTQSNEGHEFGFTIAAYTAIGGERQDLEKEPDRVLTDYELQHADTVVVHFSDAHGYKTFTGGPWDDWEEFWADIVEWYDNVSP